MIDGLNPLSGAAQQVEKSGLLQRAQQATTDTEREAIKSEFLSIFYREILKQAMPKMSFGEADDEDKTNSFGKTMASEMFINKMALELAQKGAFSADKMFSNDIEGEK